MYLGIMFSKPLEHVGIDLFVTLMVFTYLALADRNLASSCTVRGIDLQNLPEVHKGQTEFIPQQSSLSTPIQCLLICRVQLQHLANSRHSLKVTSSLCRYVIVEGYPMLYLAAAFHSLREFPQA